MSYANVGNVNGVSPYSSQFTYSIESTAFRRLFGLEHCCNGTNPNPYIKPYSVSEKEIGLELRTLNSRLNFDISVYDKKTNNQILSISLSAASGYTGQHINIAN